MGKGKTFSKTKQTDETAPEKRKAKKKRGSCCPFFGSNSAEDTDEDNAPSHDSGAIELATVVSIGKDPDHKETASQISSKHDSSYDNISSSEKTEAAVIHEALTPENKEVKSENVPNQKEMENIYEKPKEIGLGNCQATTHVPDSTTSAAQQLCEVDSVSSTSRHRVENNAEVKAQRVDPPIQRMPEPTENHQLPVPTEHYAGLQHSFKQESKIKMSDIHQENTLSLHLSKFQEDPSERQQEIDTSETEPTNDQEEKLPHPSASVTQTPHEKLPVSTIQNEDEIRKRKASTDKPEKGTETVCECCINIIVVIVVIAVAPHAHAQFIGLKANDIIRTCRPDIKFLCPGAAQFLAYAPVSSHVV